MINLDAATVMLQWAVGGLLFTWVTTRHREVGLGYGWMNRGVYLVFAALAAFLGIRYGSAPLRDVAAITTAVVTLAVLVVSIRRRKAGVRGQIDEHERRSARVAAMTGIERDVAVAERTGREFEPRLDLLAPAAGAIGLAAGAIDAGGNVWVSLLRTFVGAAFLGSISNAMLLGHWYLVQPGLPRRHISELVDWVARIWPFEVLVMLLPTGMIGVFTGSVDDGWDGLLGWMWLVCSVTTIGLVFVTKAALKEKQYSAVMAATGLLYLAILTAFGQDLVARAVLSG